jgi:hypothetical protein
LHRREKERLQSPTHGSTYPTQGPALAISKARDWAVDGSGDRVAVFGRPGSRRFTLEEMQRLYLRKGQVYTVSDEPLGPAREFKKEEQPEKEEEASGPRL